MLPLAAFLARPGNLPLVVALRDFVALGDVTRADPFPGPGFARKIWRR